MRTPYVSPYPIVAAADFANCCKHIGDRVELIGRVVRVANATEPRSAARCLRVEFGAQLHDMTCLKVWPGSHSNRDATPDETWVGKWVSAVGLVEPVAQGPAAAQRQKHISLSISEPFQLQRLTEAEALYRLRSQTERATATPDGIGSVRTDPVDPEPEMRPRPAVTKAAQVDVEPKRTVEPSPATAAAPPKVPDVSATPRATRTSQPAKRTQPARRRNPRRRCNPPEGATPAEGAASARPEAGGLGRTRRADGTARLPAVHAGGRSTVGGTEDRIRRRSPGCARGGAEAGGQDRPRPQSRSRASWCPAGP